MVIFTDLEMEDFSSCPAGEKRAKYGDCSRLVSDSAGLSPLTFLTVPGAGEESEVREDGRHVGQERPAGHHNEDGRAHQK